MPIRGSTKIGHLQEAISALSVTLTSEEITQLEELYALIKPGDIAEAFQVTGRTATNWTKEWLKKGLLKPASGAKRITSYGVGDSYSSIGLSDLGYLDQ